MSSLSRRRSRLRLVPQTYDELRKQILQRDGWRCQQCGCSANLHVHHIRSRSKLGDDVPENLITLCADCHQATHRSGRRSIHRSVEATPKNSGGFFPVSHLSQRRAFS
ncbi:MAG: HNH endonuclease [Candidatus Acidiferrales bacterium]